MIAFLQGYCPMGCGQTLVAAPGRYITCTKDTCPRPDAVSALLADPEHEHIVELNATTFCVQHPIRDRLDGDLFTCTLHTHIQAFAAPPYPPGTYRVSLDGDGWEWEPRDAQTSTTAKEPIS